MSRRLSLILVLAWMGGALAIIGAIQTLLQNPLPATDRGAIYFALFLVVAIISEMKPVTYTMGPANKNESLTITIILFTLFALDWPSAVVLAAASVVVADVVANKPYYKVLFNASMYAIATFTAGTVYHLAMAELAAQGELAPILGQILARFAAGGIYYLVNVTLLMVILAEVQRVRLGEMILWNLRDSAVVNFALVAIAIAGSLLWSIHAAAPLVLIPPIFMAKLGYQGYARLRSETHSVLAALADLLDLRDHSSGQHSLHVSELTYGVARVLGLPEAQALAIRTVVRVHDVGKIVIRDAVLLKPGALTPEERVHMKTHLEVGAQILTQLSLYKPHLSIILQHHERVDGLGYPHGLAGESIVLGARILAVCDAYDAMTSNRPYRAAMSREAAMLELRRHANTQFDPKVVEALETWLISQRELKANWRDLVGHAPTDGPREDAAVNVAADVPGSAQPVPPQAPEGLMRRSHPKTVQ